VYVISAGADATGGADWNCRRDAAFLLYKKRLRVIRLTLGKPLLRMLRRACIVAAVAGAWGAQARTYYLLSVEQVQAPAIKEKQLFYTLDLVFDEIPRHYWIYFDSRDMQLVVDIYGARVRKRPALEPAEGAIFKGLELINRETAMSLSGQQSQIIIDAEPGWHYTAENADSKTIRISAWKQIRAPEPEDKKQYRPLIYVSSAIGIAIITFLGITYGMDYLERQY
jgi:hypothetical protein